MQEILAEPSVNGSNWGVVSKYPLDWTTDLGWYVDLISPTAGIQGERVVSVPLLRQGRAIFTTLIPSSDPCDAGGTSWIVEVDMVTGGQVDSGAVFDVNQDKQFSDADTVTVNVDVDGDRVQETISHVSGIQSTVGIINTPSIISAGPIEYKFTGGSTGGIMNVPEKGDENAGRQSWRQLR